MNVVEFDKLVERLVLLQNRSKRMSEQNKMNSFLHEERLKKPVLMKLWKAGYEDKQLGKRKKLTTGFTK